MISIMDDHAQPRILSPEDSTLWQQAYLEAFVNTTGDHYRRYIATPRQSSDGVHYGGYIWDCLRSCARITVERFRHEVVGHSEVLVLADDHSRDQVLRAPLWPYPPYSVARFQSQHLLASLEELPEDIYVFDSSLSWTLVLTHEDDGRRRLCYAVGIQT